VYLLEPKVVWFFVISRQFLSKVHIFTIK